MKHAIILWNLTRCVLVLFCGYQLVSASLDGLQAERMLKITQLPSDHHDAVHLTPKFVESVRQVLRRHNPSSLYYAGLLVVFALTPYGKTRSA